MEFVDRTICQLPEATPELALRLVNNTPRPVTAELNIATPKGLQLTPADGLVKLSASGEALVPVAASVDDNLPRGKHRVTLRVTAPMENGGDKSLAYVPGAVGASEGDAVLKKCDPEVLVIPGVTCPRTAHSPVIDGKLDDPCWEAAGRLTGFVLLNSARPAAAPTTA